MSDDELKQFKNDREVWLWAWKHFEMDSQIWSAFKAGLAVGVFLSSLVVFVVVMLLRVL